MATKILNHNATFIYPDGIDIKKEKIDFVGAISQVEIFAKNEFFRHDLYLNKPDGSRVPLYTGFSIAGLNYQVENTIDDSEEYRVAGTKTLFLNIEVGIGDIIESIITTNSQDTGGASPAWEIDSAGSVTIIVNSANIYRQ